MATTFFVVYSRRYNWITAALTGLLALNHMDAFFADDSIQKEPTRSGMGPLLSTGGLYVPGDSVRDLEEQVDAVCQKYGVPDGEEFKWSPPRGSWMRSNLTGSTRTRFFEEIIEFGVQANAEAAVVIADTNSTIMAGRTTAEEHVTKLLISMIDQIALRSSTTAIIVVDRPGGGRTEEERFLTRALEMVKYGDRRTLPKHIALNPLCTTSHFIRLLQVADLIVSCATQFVAGEARFSPVVFNGKMRLLLPSDRIGGVAVAIHPELRYANLYHWLFGDSRFLQGTINYRLPIAAYPYFVDPGTP